MNTKRIITWGAFIVIIGLISWGMVAAANKEKKENINVPPADEVTAEDWISSTSTKPVTVIEYSDFQCPACGAYYPVVEKLLADNSDIVRLVYRHFPLTQHANAVPAALAAEAAGKQGKFWEMYHMLFENQADWSSSKEPHTIFTTYAEKIGLNIEKYKTDINTPELQENVNNDMKSGLKAGIDSTPTFYINGKKIKNPEGYEEFKKIIEDAAANNS